MDNKNDPAYQEHASRGLIDPFSSDEAMREVIANNIEFDEEELLLALAAMKGREKFSTDKIVYCMCDEGWELSRAFQLDV